MTSSQYHSLSPRDQLFADLLLDLIQHVKALRQDIRADLAETLTP